MKVADILCEDEFDDRPEMKKTVRIKFLRKQNDMLTQEIGKVHELARKLKSKFEGPVIGSWSIGEGSIDQVLTDIDAGKLITTGSMTGKEPALIVKNTPHNAEIVRHYKAMHSKKLRVLALIDKNNAEKKFWRGKRIDDFSKIK